MTQLKSITEARLSRTYDTSPAHLLIVAPTARELGGTRPKRQGGYSTAVVGLGHTAAATLRSALENRPPRVLLSVGFAGALVAGLRPGDVVLSRQAVAEQSLERPTAFDLTLTNDAMAALSETALRIVHGDVLTVREPLLTATDKERWGKKSSAVAVDMESYWLAREAAAADVPTVSVRVILDEMAHDLPEMVATIIANGGNNEVQHALRAMLKPTGAGALLPLAMRSRRASSVIRSAIRALVPALTKDAPLRAVYR